MGRIIALDYGKKRTGVAVTDPLQIIANGLTTIDSDQLIYWLKDYFIKETVDKIILGFPTNLDGTDTHITDKVRKVKSSLERVFPDKEVILIDEWYSSKMAFQTMIDSGISQKARRNKALIDEISATILLKDYLGH